MFKIGDFSRLTQVTIKALRYYDDLGLLKAERVDPETGYRYYSAAQVPRLNRILALKDLGLSLDQIGQFLDADLSVEQLRALLLVKQGEIRDTLEREAARLGRIEARLRQLADQAAAVEDVVVKRVDAQRVAALRRILPGRSAVVGLFQELAGYQRRHGLAATSWTVVWHDPDFRETDVDAEAAFATADPLPPDDQIRASSLPAVDAMACVVHQGPPTTLGRACLALVNWIEANGYRVVGPERIRPLDPIGPIRFDSVVELQFPVDRDPGGSSTVASDVSPASRR